jgi:uncharacterized protein YqeY
MYYNRLFVDRTVFSERDVMPGNQITSKLQEDLKVAMKEKDKLRISTLRMLINEMKKAQKEEKGELSEDKELSIISSYAKKRRESISEYEKGGREDLASSERAELDIVMTYLPEQMGEDEIRAELERIIADSGAAGPQDMGRIMGQMMGRFKGRVDGSSVKAIAMELLRGGGG